MKSNNEITTIDDKDLRDIKKSVYFSATKRNANAVKVRDLLSSLFLNSDELLLVFNAFSHLSDTIEYPASLLGIQLFNNKDVFYDFNKKSSKAADVIYEAYRLIHGFNSKKKNTSQAERDINRIDYITFANLVLAPNESSDFVYSLFNSMFPFLSSKKVNTYYISSVSPAFIYSLVMDEELLSNVEQLVIAVNSETEKELYYKNIPGLAFKGNVFFYTFDSLKKDIEENWDSHQERTSSVHYKTAFLCGNVSLNADSFMEISRLAEIVALWFLYLIPDKIIDQMRNSVNSNSFPICLLSPIPTQAFFKRGLLKQIFGLNYYNPNTPAIVSYLPMCIGKTKENSFFIYRKSLSKIARDSLFNCEGKTIRELCKPKPQTSKKEPVGIMFCREFSFWFNSITLHSQKDKIRIICTAYEGMSDRNSQKKYPRGKAISNSTVKNLFNDEYDSFETFVKERMLCRPAIHSHVKSNVIDRYRSAPISLRAAWYCYGIEPTDEGLLSYIDEDGVLWDYIFSNHSETVMVSDDSSALESSILSFASEKELSEEKIDFLINEVRRIINECVVHKHVKTNQLDYLRESRNRERQVNRSVRDLAIKSFTLDEEMYIVKESEIYGDYEIAILLRLLAGLNPPDIAALKVSDFHKIPSSRSYQLFLSKRIDKNGQIEWLTEPEECCPIPLMSFLSQKVLELLNSRGITKTLLSSITQESPEDGWLIDYEENNRKRVISTLQKYCENIEKNIERNNFNVSIRTSHGIESTDLNVYYRKKYRTTYQERLRTVCDLNESEIQFLMRTQITNTLYGHYIGMFHPCIQAALSKKLDRWGRRFQEKVSSQFSEQRIKASSSVEINQNDEIDSALILKCEYEGKLEIKVTVENGAVNHFLLEEL